MPDLERVFFASCDRDAAAAEKVLDEAGIEYSVRMEVIEERRADGVCYQGLLYEVASPAAESCRRLLTQSGLNRGVIEAEGA